jgi:serine/threonine kinase PknH
LPTVEPGPAAPGPGAPASTAGPTETPPAAADAEPTLVTPVPPAPGEAGEAGEAGDEQVGAGEPARPDVADEPDPGGTPEPDPEGPGDATDQPTQAGVPIFHEDTDDVSWLRKRTEKPAPPPPLEDPPERPLFAPDPPDGGPARRPRPGAATGARATSATGATGTGAGTAGVSREDTGGTGSGSWGTGSWGTGSWVSNTADTGPVEPVPGRNWFRLAVIVGICTLVLVAALAAYQLGGTGDDEADDAPDSPTASQTTPAQPIEGVTAEDFDPQGSPPQDENPDLVPLVLDDDPSTAWRTATYLQNFGPAGLKTGVGLRLDLGEAREVSEVDVSVVGRTTAEVYVTEEPPETVDGLDPLGEGTSAGTVEVRPDEAVTGRYVTVWLTSLPSVDGGWRGEVSGVVVRG